MDWQTILASVGASGGLTALVVYAAKRSLDHAMEVQTQKLIEHNKTAMAEVSRRQGQLFDEQADALKLALSLCYRLRNTLRDMRELAPEDDTAQAAHLMTRARGYQDAIRGLLFEKRAVLPDEPFVLLHKVQGRLQLILSSRNIIRHAKAGGESDIDVRSRLAEIAGEYDAVDKAYAELSKVVRGFIGVT